jgi:hypothetical protein
MKKYFDKHVLNDAYSQLVTKCKEWFPEADKTFHSQENSQLLAMLSAGTQEGFGFVKVWNLGRRRICA